jgi:hypothetical protein
MPADPQTFESYRSWKKSLLKKLEKVAVEDG